VSQVDEPTRSRAADVFARELTAWRRERGLSQKQLAERVGFDPSYISHIESSRYRPSEAFAARVDHALAAGGALRRRFEEQIAGSRPPAAARPPVPPDVDIVVDREEARLSYLGGTYFCEVRRRVRNVGPRPVVRHPARIWPDRFPGDPEQSLRWYRDHPVTLEELHFTAELDGDDPGAVEWSLTQDRDSYKELDILFRTGDVKRPLYPGNSTTICYRYQMSELKWGQWFQREVRFLTRDLTMMLDLPTRVRPTVWGMYAPMSSEPGPLPTPVTTTERGDRTRFTWFTTYPPLLTSIRLEWRFAAPDRRPSPRRNRVDLGGAVGEAA
jgi:transcriptional regulator with XRE-family HTH domain